MSLSFSAVINQSEQKLDVCRQIGRARAIILPAVVPTTLSVRLSLYMIVSKTLHQMISISTPSPLEHGVGWEQVTKLIDRGEQCDNCSLLTVPPTFEGQSRGHFSKNDRV